MKFKNILMIFILGLMQLIPASSAGAAQKILLAVYNDNPDYSSVRKVFVRELTQEADRLGMDIEFVDFTKTRNRREFIQKIKEYAKEIDLIFTAGTPNAMAIKEAEVDVPVLFTAVADPKKANLVKTFHRPASNFTGAYCAVAAHTQLQTILKVMPNVKILGILYNPRDPAPVSQLHSWEKAAAYLPEIKILSFQIPASVDSEEKMAEATEGMIGLADVIVTLADAQVSSYGKGMIKAANNNNIPTYVSLSHLVGKGALFSFGFNFDEATKVVNVPQAIKILQGIPPEAISVGTYPYYDLSVNLKTAGKIGVNFTEEVIDSAANKIE